MNDDFNTAQLIATLFRQSSLARDRPRHEECTRGASGCKMHENISKRRKGASKRAGPSLKAAAETWPTWGMLGRAAPGTGACRAGSRCRGDGCTGLSGEGSSSGSPADAQGVSTRMPLRRSLRWMAQDCRAQCPTNHQHPQERVGGISLLPARLLICWDTGGVAEY
jgi:hypothetical protein